MQELESAETLKSDELLPLVYDELRQLAAKRMAKGGPPQTLQPTALVHEAWLQISGNKEYGWNDRAHFFRAAALAMRRIMVDRAREKAALKRGNWSKPVSLAEIEIADTGREERILQVDEMLERLETEDPCGARVVTLKFFGGLTEQEIASIQEVNVRTIRRQWRYARTRLFQMIEEDQGNLS